MLGAEATDHTVKLTETVRGHRPRNITTSTHMNTQVSMDTGPDTQTTRLTVGRRQTRPNLTAQNHVKSTPETLKNILNVTRNDTPRKPRRRRTRGVTLEKMAKMMMDKKFPPTVRRALTKYWAYQNLPRRRRTRGVMIQKRPKLAMGKKFRHATRRRETKYWTYLNFPGARRGRRRRVRDMMTSSQMTTLHGAGAHPARSFDLTCLMYLVNCPRADLRCD